MAMDEEILVAEPPSEGNDLRKWYVIHTYSGYENKVKTNLEHRIDSMGVRDRIFQVVIPTEEEIEIRDGQRRTVARKIFPGYVLVQMIPLQEDDLRSSQAWFVVRNTPGVTSFVGGANIPGVRSEPIPLDENEVKQILRHMGVETPKFRVAFISYDEDLAYNLAGVDIAEVKTSKRNDGFRSGARSCSRHMNRSNNESYSRTHQ